MVCRECGAEIAKGAKVCRGCGKAARKQSKLTCLNVAIIVFVIGFLFMFLTSPGVIDGFLYREIEKREACLRSLQSLSKGLQTYLVDKRDFNKLTQSGGNGDEICAYVLPGYEKAADCVGKLPEKSKQNCLDYRIDVNKPVPFEYEISGHSNHITKCGICVTEAGYCPKKYSGKEPEDSPCKKSCKDAGVNSTAVCPH